jgi:hypothetical protein
MFENPFTTNILTPASILGHMFENPSTTNNLTPASIHGYISGVGCLRKRHDFDPSPASCTMMESIDIKFAADFAVGLCGLATNRLRCAGLKYI